MHKFLGAYFVLVTSACIITTPVLAQSLDVKNPAPLQSGNNIGTADSFVGSHYWYFTAQPGSFSGALTRLESPGSASKANLGVGVAFAPKTADATLFSKDKGAVTNFSGTVKVSTRVVVMIDPGPSGLVRAACNYELHAGGSVGFATASSKPGIIGTFMCMQNDYGLTKFQDGGTLVTASGTPGKWELFDPDTKTYVVTINDRPNEHMSLKLIPGRGLVDANSTDIVIFKQLH